MKTFILAVDGLEHDFVVKHGLKNLLQEEYGRVQIPKETYVRGIEGEVVPYTPIIWACFLTGRLPQEHGVYSDGRWNNRVLNFISKLSVKHGLLWIRGKGKYLEKLGFKRKSFTKEDYKIKTIFDLTDKWIQVNVPTVDSRWKMALVPNESNLSLEEIAKLRLEHFYRVRREVMEKVGGEWNLFMGYTRIVDVYGHMYWGLEGKMLEVYGLMNDFVRELKKKLPKEVFFLIVSDHGMRRIEGLRYGGTHSDHGFYSTNIKVGLGNPKMTDFYHLIEKILKV